MSIRLNLHLIKLVVVSIFLASCASAEQKMYYFDEITIRNNSFKNVTDVKIRVEKTGMVFSCSFIPPKGECSNKFRKRQYLGNPVTLSWVFNNGISLTKTVRSTLPKNALTTKMLKGMMEIDGHGRIIPYLYQE